MRYAITQRNTPQTHLKPRYTKELPVRACAEHAHAYACAGKQTLARFARLGALHSLRCPSKFAPNPSLTSFARASCLLRAVETPALRRQGKGKGCAIAYQPLRALFPPMPLPMHLVLRAAVRLRLSVGLLATPSNALAFRAVCSRASLPQCANMFLPSPAPCGGRAFRGGPRPAHGLAGLARITACARSCGLQPLPSLRSGDSGAMRPRAPLRSARKFATRQQGFSALAGLSRCSRPNPPQGRQPSPACDIFNLYLRAAYGLAAHVRYAHPLKIQNKC